MKLKEEKILSTERFIGKIIKVKHDEIRLPNDETSMREVVEHPGGVCIAVCDQNNQFILVEQFRYAFDDILLEFAAGKLEKDEEPYQAALRELEEETGYQAKSLINLGMMYPSPGYLTEIIYLYLASDTTYVGQKLDHHEFLNLKAFPLDELTRMVNNNTIKDAKTCLMVYKLNEYYKERIK